MFANNFALLGDDTEDISAMAAKAAREAAKAKAQAESAPAPSASAARPARGGRGGRGPRNGPAETRDDAPAPAGRAGGRGGRGRGRGRGDHPHRGREYDRRDGTGRAHENKKGGAGKGNWGVEGEEAQDAATPADKLEPEAEVEREAAEQPAEPVEDEPKQVTLDDYLAAEYAEKRAALQSQMKTEQRTVDKSQFSGMQKVQKAEKLAEDLLDGFSSKDKTKQHRVKELKGKNVVNVDIKFSDGGPAGGPRGEGGRGRGRGGRAGGRPALEAAVAGAAVAGGAAAPPPPTPSPPT
ncbi:unnamed protein product [Pedinophyceae sp. YPF-701]|nr:unnamed protein product [Pedinophyceae sp. YPF-701]